MDTTPARTRRTTPCRLHREPPQAPPALYLSEPILTDQPCYLRPGGAELTRRLWKLLIDLRKQGKGVAPPGPAHETAAAPASTPDCAPVISGITSSTTWVADIGCGRGASLELINSLQKSEGAQSAGTSSTRLLGIDLHPGLLQTAQEHIVHTAHAEASDARQNCAVNLSCGDMAALPLKDNSMDVLLSECAWNLSDHDRALEEFHRVIRPGGLLGLIDIYHRTTARTDNEQAEQWPIHSCLARSSSMHEIEQQVVRAGFTIRRLEDHSPLLSQAAARYVMQYGSLENFWHAVTGNRAHSAQLCRLGAAAKPGLFLMIGERRHD